MLGYNCDSDGALSMPALDFSVLLKSHALPMRTLMVGNFGCLSWAKMDINSSQFDQQMAKLNVVCSVKVADQTLDLSFNKISDFEPDNIVQNCPYLRNQSDLLDELRQLAGKAEEDILSIPAYWQSQLTINNALSLSDNLWVLFNELSKHLQSELNTIFNDSTYCELQRNWLSLKQLVTSTASHDDQIITLLNLDLPHFDDDLLGLKNITDSRLFDVIYNEELGQFGGQPYHCVSYLYEFSHHAADCIRLSQLADIASLSQCIALTSIDSSVLKELTDEPLNQPSFRHWQALVERPSSQYLVCSVLKYQYRDMYKSFTLTKGVRFSEISENLDVSAQLWSSFSHFLIILMADVMAAQGTCLGLSGNDSNCDIQTLCQRMNVPALTIDQALNSSHQLSLSELGALVPQVSKYWVRFQTICALSSARSFTNVNGTTRHSLSLLEQSVDWLMLQNQLARQLKILVREFLGYGNIQDVKELVQAWLTPFVASGGYVSKQQWQSQPLANISLGVEENVRGEAILLIKLQAHHPDSDELIALSFDWAG
jgi:type VI secretion system protein ImpC